MFDLELQCVLRFFANGFDPLRSSRNVISERFELLIHEQFGELLILFIHQLVSGSEETINALIYRFSNLLGELVVVSQIELVGVSEFGKGVAV